MADILIQIAAFDASRSSGMNGPCSTPERLRPAADQVRFAAADAIGCLVMAPILGAVLVVLFLFGGG